MAKRAAIHLSIEVIVLIIISAVFLALAIIFVGYIFYNANIDVKDMFNSVTKARIEQLRLSDKTFDLESYSLDIKQGEQKQIFMLLRNEGSDENYYWMISHTVTNLSSKIQCLNISFNYKPTINVLPGQESIPPLIIEAPEKVDRGTCLFEIKAKDSNNNVQTLDLTLNVIR